MPRWLALAFAPLIIAPALAQSPLVNPPPGLLAQLRNFRTLSDAEEVSFTRIFLDAIGG